MPPAPEPPLTGFAQHVWKDVVVDGQHLAITRDGAPVAVILPHDDFVAMVEAIRP